MEQHLEAKSERLSTVSSSSPAEALGVFVLSRSASLRNSSLLGFTGAIVGSLLKQDDSYFPTCTMDIEIHASLRKPYS